MPAVTYYDAAQTMAAHGDEVLDYIQEGFGELPTPPSDISWNRLACHYLSCAVELWAGSVEEDLEAALDARDALSAPTHTPGPWYVSLNPYVIGQRAEIGGPYRAIAEVRNATGLTEDGSQHKALAPHDEILASEARANAHLIAAAPDLLEALATLLGACEVDCMDDKSNVYRSAMINANTALARAEGRSV